MGPGARAKILVTDNDVTQKELARAVGISPAKLSNYLTEKNEMPCRVVAGIARYFPVSTDYLLGLTERADRPPDVNREEQGLVERYRTLSREQKEILQHTVRLMAEQNSRRE